MNPGDIVSGTVAYVGDTVIVVDIATPKGLAKGYLTFPHLSDSLGWFIEHITPSAGILLSELLENLVILVRPSILTVKFLLAGHIEPLKAVMKVGLKLDRLLVLGMAATSLLPCIGRRSLWLLSSIVCVEISRCIIYTHSLNSYSCGFSLVRLKSISLSCLYLMT